MVSIVIVHSSGDAHQGGTITFLRAMLGRLNEGRFRWVVIFLNGGPLVEEFRARGISVVTLNAGRVRHVVSTIGAVHRIREVLRREDISLVLSNGPKEHIYGGLAARLARVPAVWYCHGLRPDSPLIRWAAAAVPTRMILTHGEHTLARVEKSYRAPARSIPIGIELPAGGSSGVGVREEFGIGPEVPVVTIVGLLMRWKGQDVFLDAAAQIRACQPQARFLVVGDRPADGDAAYVAALRQQIRSLGLDRAVTFTGFRHDVQAIMAASDVVVHASTSPEPFGIVLLEAMAAARPVVATALGGPLEIVVPGETGLLVPPGEPNALAEAALFLLERPALRRAMGENGRKRVETLFTADRMARDLEAVLGECVGRVQ
ncbi:MAG: glycosyltransferase family 4 protein [Candidatus Rokubacteria bacterium]|nr:glycosyltransferase family 4 protein [Candidatus Rokubacteria bacterium]